MKTVDINDLKQFYIPSPSSHKGQNGRLLIIGGSYLFHAASLWALKVASRIVDLVHYSSVPENNELVMRLKTEFRDGIVIPRNNIEEYIQEDDCILIGPGMVRTDNSKFKNQNAKLQFKIQNLKELEKVEDDGIQTMVLTNYLLKKHPQKQWVIDAGALQKMDVELIPKNAILTPHHQEFEQLQFRIKNLELRTKLENLELKDQIKFFAQMFQCIVLVKGETDMAFDGSKSNGRICLPGEVTEIKGGNAGMTKGGTGDVLAGLIAALATKNEPFLATIAGSFINKKAGDELYKRVGPYFNASDLAEQIPQTMKALFIG